MLGFRYNERKNLEYVLEGIAYEEGKVETFIGFKIVEDKHNARALVDLRRGPPVIKCLDFFRKVLLKYARETELNQKDDRLNAVYSVWRKLCEEDKNYIDEKLTVFRNIMPSFLDDIRWICSKAAEGRVRDIAVNRGIPEFDKICTCLFDLGEYRRNKKELPDNFNTAYESIASIHVKALQSLNNLFQDLKQELSKKSL
jgi:hypothetical protein